MSASKLEESIEHLENVLASPEAYMEGTLAKYLAAFAEAVRDVPMKCCCGMTLRWPLEQERHKCPTHDSPAGAEGMRVTFTDEDLKRLKEIIGEPGLITHNMGVDVYKALLARLEAAENARSHHAAPCTCDWCRPWRKAAGK